jgi:hypothetical protein
MVMGEFSLPFDILTGKYPDKRRLSDCLYRAKQPRSLAPNSAEEPLLTCGPGRMIWNYIPDARLYRITAWRFSAYFVAFDIM